MELLKMCLVDLEAFYKQPLVKAAIWCTFIKLHANAALNAMTSNRGLTLTRLKLSFTQTMTKN